jgi:hypothetical protein
MASSCAARACAQEKHVTKPDTFKRQRQQKMPPLPLTHSLHHFPHPLPPSPIPSFFILIFKLFSYRPHRCKLGSQVAHDGVIFALRVLCAGRVLSLWPGSDPPFARSRSRVSKPTRSCAPPASAARASTLTAQIGNRRLQLGDGGVGLAASSGPLSHPAARPRAVLLAAWRLSNTN